MRNKFIKKIISQSNEVTVEIVRKSLWGFFWQIIFAIILINLPFFLIYPLFRQGFWGLVIFFIILALAVIFIYQIYIKYYYTVLLITNKRLIDIEQRGFLNRSVNTVLYNKIQDIECKSKGFINSFLKTGDVLITFIGDSSSVIKLDLIKNPNYVCEIIMNQRDLYIKERRVIAGEKAIRLLKKIKNKLGENKFNELISD